MTLPHAVLNRPASVSPETQAGCNARFPLLALAALTAGVFLVHGYHPFADDADIYVAGIEKLANPALFRPDAAYVLATTRLSVFAHLIAFVLRHTRISVEMLLLSTYLLTVFAYLCAVWGVASRLFQGTRARWSATLLAAAFFTLPVAGTALVIMDPYVTSRSLATPLGLFALSSAMDRRLMRTTLLIALALLMHPLLGAYAGIFVVFLFLVTIRHRDLTTLLFAVVVGAAAVTCLATRHVPVLPAYSQAIHHGIRTFLFPSEWTWYEDAGLLAPLALLGIGAYRTRGSTTAGRLCQAAVLAGSSCGLAAFLFVPVHGPYLLTRLQPLRSFLMVYATGTLLLGGFLGEWLIGEGRPTHRRWRLSLAAVLLLACIAGMFFAQRSTYSHSAHIEMPGNPPRNPWQQAFGWIADHTPANAVFAADPGMAFESGEDSQGFRSTTQRSLLASDKDEGVIVAAAPQLAETWATARNAQAGINTMTDQQRKAQLRPMGVNWLLLSANAVTALACPYRNTAVQVCELGSETSSR